MDAKEEPFPSISVIIPTYNRADRIIECLAGFLASGPDEVIVVLDGPQPKTMNAIHDAGLAGTVKVRELAANVGLALARIEGLREATSDVILIADDDVIPDENLIAVHRAFHRDRSSRDVAVGYMPVAASSSTRAKPSQSDAASRIYAREYQKTTEAWVSNGYVVPLSQLWNGNVSLSRELYLEAEEYLASIRLTYNEDLDLGLRLEQCGASATFLPSALAEHRHHRPKQSLVGEARSRGASARILEQRWGYLPFAIEDLVKRKFKFANDPLYALIDLNSVVSVGAHLLLGSSEIFAKAGAHRIEETTLRIVRRIVAVNSYRRFSEGTHP